MANAKPYEIRHRGPFPVRLSFGLGEVAVDLPPAGKSAPGRLEVPTAADKERIMSHHAVVSGAVDVEAIPLEA